ncbi:hypothetical protein MC885_005024 [Smutsia gigantea]|nr:hypothetical protein MC885_005024 [Smutsia gigantea]
MPPLTSQYKLAMESIPTSLHHSRPCRLAYLHVEQLPREAEQVAARGGVPSVQAHACVLEQVYPGLEQRRTDRRGYETMLLFSFSQLKINKRGQVIDVHNDVHMVTVGITYSTPKLLIPDIMLLECAAVSCAGCNWGSLGGVSEAADGLELTRLLPLKLVKLSIYSHEKKQLPLKLFSGRSFYLQLCPTSHSKRLFR